MRGRPTLPSLILGLVMMLVGFYLAWPSLLGMWTYQRVDGRIVEVLPEPVGDGTTRLALRFDYRVDGPHDPQAAEIWCLGADRCDAMGRPLPPLVVPDVEVDDWRRRLVGTGHRQVVYYDPARPLASGRMFLVEDPGSMTRETIGMVLLITPPIAWSCVLIGLALRPRPNRRRT